ncbi:DUF4942 domain-containing protein [Xenorhabdus bovienii]|nr:DUF4942 domain-containing protein [Xenorhabdus bovienii]
MSKFFSDESIKSIKHPTSEHGMLFKQAVARSFSHLDRRFRAHDGWVPGGSIYMPNLLGVRNEWDLDPIYRQDLTDIETIFSLLDGKDPPENNMLSITDALIDAGNNFQGRAEKWVDSKYIVMKINEKRECNIWFKRDDLVEEITHLIGDYYGVPDLVNAGIGESCGLYEPTLSLARDYGFFPTPIEVGQRVIAEAEISHLSGSHRLSVLEPSAGLGNLAKLAVEAGGIVDCIEVHAERCVELENSRLFRRIMNTDFISIEPNLETLYDRIIMNPPFEDERDIDHVVHALKFLKSDGLLVSIMSPGTEFRQRRKSGEFRDLMKSLNAQWSDLPEDAFASVGSHSNTILLKVWKDGR